jgi:hypothetical protein
MLCTACKHILIASPPTSQPCQVLPVLLLPGAAPAAAHVVLPVAEISLQTCHLPLLPPLLVLPVVQNLLLLGHLHQSLRHATTFQAPHGPIHRCHAAIGAACFGAAAAAGHLWLLH